MKTKPKVGQPVYILLTGYRAREYGKEQERLRPGVVVSVGRKYFTVEHGEQYKNTDKFRIEDWRQENGGYSETVMLYSAPECYHEEHERMQIAGRVRKAFEWRRVSEVLPIECLRAINQAIVDAGILKDGGE
jgi:hypothetical protein